MGQKNQTTVNLTEDARIVKMKYINAYGLKGILSAGLILLDKLSPETREILVSEVIANDKKKTKNVSLSEQKYAVLEGLGERIVADLTQKDKKKRHKSPKAG